MQFENLPNDNLVVIALKLDITDITNFCRLNRKFNHVICNNQNFWIQKLYKDFNMNYLDFNNPPTKSSDIKIDTPKEFYERVDKISKLTNFYNTYKYTGYNIKLIDYYLENNGGVNTAIEEVNQLSNTREVIKMINHLLKKNGNLKYAMFGAAKYSNMQLIEYIEHVANETLTLEKRTEVFNEGIKGAGYINDYKLIEYFTAKGANWRDLLLGLAYGGHEKSLDSYFNQDLDIEGNLYMGMIVAASLGNRENILEYLIGFKGSSLSPINRIIYNNPDLRANVSSQALLGVGYNNNRKLIYKLIDENGANNMNMGLFGAASGGVIELIDYFIDKGATDYVTAFSVAIATGNRKAADYLFNYINFDINETNVQILIQERNKAAFRYIKKLGFNNWEAAINQARNQDPNMVSIIEEVRDE